MRVLWCLFLFWMLMWPASVRAQELVLTNLLVDNLAGDVLVRFGMGVSDAKELEAMLQEGEAVRLTCRARLTRSRTLWWSKTLAEGQWQLVLRHDPLTDIYVAAPDVNGNEPPQPPQPQQAEDAQPPQSTTQGEAPPPQAFQGTPRGAPSPQTNNGSARNQGLRSKDFQNLLDKALGSVVINLGPWRNLERGRDYSLSLVVDVERMSIPVWLKRTLFFLRLDAAPSAEYQLDFAY